MHASSLGVKAVLQVDLKKADRELVPVITEHFSQYGRVMSVRIHRSPTPFVLVEMTSHMETMELAAQYGGSTFGTSALIHLEQEPQ